MTRNIATALSRMQGAHEKYYVCDMLRAIYKEFANAGNRCNMVSTLFVGIFPV